MGTFFSTFFFLLGRSYITTKNDGYSMEVYNALVNDGALVHVGEVQLRSIPMTMQKRRALVLLVLMVIEMSFLLVNMKLK
jgi:hypothetical protein